MLGGWDREGQSRLLAAISLLEVPPSHEAGEGDSAPKNRLGKLVFLRGPTAVTARQPDVAHLSESGLVMAQRQLVQSC